MTQIKGIYCNLCHRRYVYHACQNGMPCKHEENPIANFFFCYAWIYKRGYKIFEITRIRIKKADGVILEPLEGFVARYVTIEELTEQFLQFLRTKAVYTWLDWVEAFVSLRTGGRGQDLPPKWRLNQLIRRGVRRVSSDPKKEAGR